MLLYINSPSIGHRRRDQANHDILLVENPADGIARPLGLSMECYIDIRLRQIRGCRAGVIIALYRLAMSMTLTLNFAAKSRRDFGRLIKATAIMSRSARWGRGDPGCLG